MLEERWAGNCPGPALSNPDIYLIAYLQEEECLGSGLAPRTSADTGVSTTVRLLFAFSKSTLANVRDLRVDVPASFADAKGAENQVEDVVGRGGAGNLVELAESVV